MNKQCSNYFFSRVRDAGLKKFKCREVIIIHLSEYYKHQHKSCIFLYNLIIKLSACFLVE
jgi:hypothetical protein